MATWGAASQVFDSLQSILSLSAAVPDGRYSGVWQVLAASPEALALARGEIAVVKRLQHPNLLPLLGSALLSVDTAAGGRAQVALGWKYFGVCVLGGGGARMRDLV